MPTVLGAAATLQIMFLLFVRHDSIYSPVAFEENPLLMDRRGGADVGLSNPHAESLNNHICA